MEGWSNMSTEVLAKTTFRPESFICVVAEIDLNKSRPCSSLKCWQVAKCRLLLLSHPNLLVSPDRAFLEEIRILLPKDFHDTNVLDNFLCSSSLIKRDMRVQLNSEILEETLLFTLIVRLSYDWNVLPVSENGTERFLLIQGRDFLVEASKNPVDAFILRVFKKDDSMWIGIRVCLIRLPTVRPEYLDIRSRYLEEMHSCPAYSIDQSKIGEPIVYVLPNLRRGRITSLTSGIPPDSDFSSYKAIQQHWKRTYGFILPDKLPNENLQIATLFFEDVGRSFVCPLKCLLRAPPVCITKDEPFPQIKKVLGTIKKVMDLSLVRVNEKDYSLYLIKRHVKPAPSIVNGDVLCTGTKNETTQKHKLVNLLDDVLEEENKSISNGSISSDYSTNTNTIAQISATRPSRLSLTRPIRRSEPKVCSCGSNEQKNGNRNCSPPPRPPADRPTPIEKVSESPIVRLERLPEKTVKVRRRKLDTDIDIETLFKKGCLQKATKLQLLKWLKAHGVKGFSTKQKAVIITCVSSKLAKTK